MSLKLEWHDMNDLIGVILKKLTKPLSQHRVIVQASESVPLVVIDFRLMEHAIANILLNAATYSPARAIIHIKLGKVDSAFQFLVEDVGPGVPEESLNKIFEKFYRVPGTPAGGTGLGLLRLNLHGYKIAEAESGRSGLDKTVEFHPHLIILDLGLPDMNGYDVLKDLRKWSQISVIVLTVADNEDIKVRLLDAGADDYLTKPFSVPELLARVRVALRTHGQLLKQIWGSIASEQSHYLRIYINQLRKKLELDPSRPEHIITEPGVGYRII